MKGINQRRMHYFYEVLMCGSIRAASDKLNTCGSVITRQIKILEEELAIMLFERRPHGMIPTEAAQGLLQYYRGCCAQLEILEAYFQELRGLQRGNIIVAASEGFIDTFMDNVLNDFCRQYPKLNIDIELTPVNEVVSRVAEDAAHIGLAYNPPTHPNIRYRASARQPVCLLVDRNHPLTAKSSAITLGEAIQYPLGLMPASFGLRQILQLLEISEKIRLTPILTTNSLAILKKFVKDSHGVTFMPAFAAYREIKADELVALEIDNAILAAAETRAIVRLGRPLSAAVNKLLRLIIAKLPLFES